MMSEGVPDSKRCADMLLVKHCVCPARENLSYQSNGKAQGITHNTTEQKYFVSDIRELLST
jgi:hypothetical protein